MGYPEMLFMDEYEIWPIETDAHTIEGSFHLHEPLRSGARAAGDDGGGVAEFSVQISICWTCT